MLDLFAPTKPRNTHVRSQSTPYLPHTPNNPTAPNPHLSSHGQSSSSSSIPQPPSLTHPPTHTFQPTHAVPPLVTQGLQRTRPTRSRSKLADWFTGESDPISFTIVPSPIKVKSDSVGDMDSPFPGTDPAYVETQPAAQGNPRPPIISRFSLFGNKSSTPKAPVLSAELDDQWLKLDVKTALASSASTEPFSPSAFKNLQQSAESLLGKFQTAYKERSRALHDVLAEKETQAEELEGAQMRTRHLKLQLDAMTAKLAEQDKAMMDLVDQLAQEKQARREAEDAHSRNLNQRPAVASDQDEAIQDAQQNVKSWKSRTSTASDMSLASEDSCAESLFSRRGATSPTLSMSSVSTMNSPESQHQQPGSMDRTRRPTAPTNVTTHIAETKISGALSPISASLGQCAKCSRLKDSEAWSLVSMLKLENQGLKIRLSQLESTVDECLDMVKGLF
ncbi:MAG: hypothetical protein Q9201_005014 [Fulgogasparrea decipioides]